MPTTTFQVFSYDATNGFIGIWGPDLAEGFGAILIDPRSPFIIHSAHWSWRYGVQVTFDGGQTWEETINVMPSGLSRAPDNPDVLWLSASSPGEIYRSTDNGLTWNLLMSLNYGSIVALSSDSALVTNGGDVKRISASASTATTVSDGVTSQITFIGRTLDGSAWIAADKLYRSADDGQTFTALALSVPEVSEVAVHPSNPARIFVGTSTGMLVSSDGGQTWEDTGAPFAVSTMLMTPDQVLYVGTDHAGLYKYVP
jgi:photosystem II stability/assembly factor-like uncharacterized protein